MTMIRESFMTGGNELDLPEMRKICISTMGNVRDHDEDVFQMSCWNLITSTLAVWYWGGLNIVRFSRDPADSENASCTIYG